MRQATQNVILLCSVTSVLLFNSAVANEKSPRLAAALQYEIGGGYISEPPTRSNGSVTSLELGVNWDVGMECGKFDPKISVSNQLNGITEGFRNMMNNIIQSATSAVASLPAMAIQKANPGLYDMLQQGILQGKMDFEFAETSCEQMAQVFMGNESFPFEDYKVSAESNVWSEKIEESNGDAVKAKNEVDEVEHGDEGVEWACGDKKGGAGMESLKALSDVISVGYNILFDRTDVCSTADIHADQGVDAPLWRYWSGPSEAVEWSKKVIGEMQIRTCKGCKKMEALPGRGLTYMHREMRLILESNLKSLVNGETTLRWQNLNVVSAPPGVVVSAPLIEIIRKKNPYTQDSLIRKLASEIAYARLVEQGRYLILLLNTGLKEPNIAAYEPAKKEVHEAIDRINNELNLLDKEIKTRKAVAQESIIKLLGFEEKQIQETVIKPDRRRPSPAIRVGE